MGDLHLVSYNDEFKIANIWLDTINIELFIEELKGIKATTYQVSMLTYLHIQDQRVTLLF